MQAQHQDIGEEQGNDWGTQNDAYSDLALWANNRWRGNDTQYYLQTSGGFETINAPIRAGWQVRPEVGNGGTWWARIP